MERTVFGRMARPVRLVAVAAIVLMAGSCSSNAKAPPPKVEGLLGFDENQAVDSNGTIETADPFVTCGSTTATFGTELLSTPPNKAVVRYEWGQIDPGHQMFEAGTAAMTSVGHGGDLPFTHPFGDDITTDVKLDAPYGPLAQTVGTQPNTILPGSLHTEIAEGLLPHGSDGQIQPDFIMQDGDRVAAVGDWILDCGHPDFHSEIHPPSFLAFGHVSGSNTVVQAVYNPYVATQLFSPDTSILADFSNTKRFTDPNTLPFPRFLYFDILRLGGLAPKPFSTAARLEAPMLIDANRTPSSVTWFVCAPPGGSGDVKFTSKFTVRQGVTITASPDNGLGCVRFDATIGSGYTPLEPQLHSCELSWATLTQQAIAAIGNKNLDVRKAIEAQVPKSFIPKVEKNPVIQCYTPPPVPPPGGPSGQATFTSNDQPFPFYGTVQVSRSS